MLPSINDWLESYGSLDSNQLEESIKATGLVSFVKAEVTLEHFTELLGHGQAQGVTDAMENDEMSDARFAEIMAAVGDLFEDIYMQKLEKTTASYDSLDQYRRTSLEVGNTPCQLPLEWLQKLAITDFTNIQAVGSLYVDLRDNLGHFDLVTNGETIYAMAPYPDAILHKQPLDSDFHPILLNLKASTLPGTGDSLPTVVFAVGQVERARYVIIVDAVAPEHPVWMVYKCGTCDDMDEERRTGDPACEPLVFEGIGHNFGAAQIFPSIHDWIQSYGNVDFARFE
ncbi:hypothetical protein F52700_8343 [Fusarium sp. NRRL 52700]|nr:hypothetical protein F52700_8343 [Fusarium sp. NRRL 52700]